MIRCAEAKQEDIPGIIEVMKNTGYASFAFKGKTDAQIPEVISKSKNTYLICFETKLSHPQKIIGYFIFSSVQNHLKDANEHAKINKEYAYHLGIGIHSNYRGKKLGSRLTRYALKKAKKLGYKGMYADVGSDNLASLRLQESIGFERIAEYPSEKRNRGIKNILFVKHF